MRRILFCQNTWPESDSRDFKVFDLEPGETKEEAILRAQKFYNKPADQFYIVEERSVSELELETPDYESRRQARDYLNGEEE